MATKTHIWNGKPIELMEDEFMAKAYKCCWLVVYYYERSRSCKKDDEYTAKSLSDYYYLPITIDRAEKFAILFEEELKRRGRKFKRPVKADLFKYLRARINSKEYVMETYNKIIPK